jgi:probable rRNA maturation factor
VYTGKDLNTRKKSNLTLINQSRRTFVSEDFQPVLDVVEQYEYLDGRSLNLMLTDNGYIRELNRKFRGKDALTDVISFPSQQEFAPFLGDIIIDIDVAAEQKGKRSLLDELQMLFLHGLLHLLGYDHIVLEAGRIMKMKEDKYFSMIKENK